MFRHGNRKLERHRSGDPAISRYGLYKDNGYYSDQNGEFMHFALLYPKLGLLEKEDEMQFTRPEEYQITAARQPCSSPDEFRLTALCPTFSSSLPLSSF
jgi:hypothetical protein